MEMRNRNSTTTDKAAEDESGWVKVDSPPNSPAPSAETSLPLQLQPATDGSNIQVSENMQSIMDNNTELSTADYKRGRAMLSQRRATEETEKARGRQAAVAKAEWDTIVQYVGGFCIFLFLMYAFFRWGPVLKKPGSPGTETNEAIQKVKESADEKFGKPLADLLMPGLRL